MAPSYCGDTFYHQELGNLVKIEGIIYTIKYIEILEKNLFQSFSYFRFYFGLQDLDPKHTFSLYFYFLFAKATFKWFKGKHLNSVS